MDTPGRPSITIDLGTDHRPLRVSVLVDTGAGMSVMRKDICQRYFQGIGRPYVLERVCKDIYSASGHAMVIEGAVELKLPEVGVVKFHIVKDMIHECILGWDMMYAHGFRLDDDIFHWGSKTYLHEPYKSPGSVQAITPRMNALDKLLQRYRSIFGQAGTLDVARVPPLEIRTASAEPVNTRPYHPALHKLAVADEEIDKMLKMGIIRPSASPWASPITLVPKKDGSTRFCIDYRKVNAVTEKDRWPLPHIQEIFDQMGGSAIFSTMDMRSGYWQVPLSKEAIPKTAFVCHRGQFEFLRVPFGLANAPSHYQRIMTQVLGKYIGKFVMVFLDDIVVYSKDTKQHLEHLNLVFEALSGAHLTVKESKCTFFKTEVDLLGYIVGADGLKAQPTKTNAIEKQPPPSDITALRRFLGMATYYRQLVPEFSKIAEPLNKLTRKDVPFVWGKAQQTAFVTLKGELASDRIMAFPQLNKPYILYTDACDYAIGAILCQEDENGCERPIQYLSAQLTSTQRKWATIEKEAFAVIYALKKLRPYLLGADFTVYTDHKPLLSFFVGEVKNTKIQRWAILIAEYGARIKYRPGQNNVRADMLSRLPATEDDNPQVNDARVDMLSHLSVGDMAILDTACEWVFPEEAESPQPPVMADELDTHALRLEQEQEFADEWKSARDGEQGFLINERLLYSVNRTQRHEPRYPRLLLPERFRDKVVTRCHKEGGHCGAIKTMRRVQDNYVWPGMRKWIEVWYKKCGHCLVHSSLPDHPPMGEMPIAKSPGQIVGCDLIGPLVDSVYGNRYILTLIDHYSGWIEAYPLPRKTNENVWKALRSDYFPRHGSPRVIISDQGSEFKGAEFHEWLEANGTEHRRTTPFHPQSNGKTERANRSIKTTLRKLINGDRARWEDELPNALWALHTNISSVTEHSLFMLNHARPMRTPVQSMLKGREGNGSLEDRLTLQKAMFRQAAEATRESRKYNRERLAKKANAGDLKEGDYVILRANEPVSLTAKWDYVYLVTRVNGLAITITHIETGKSQMVHREKLKIVDPQITWDEVHPRPRRVRAHRAPPPVSEEHEPPIERQQSAKKAVGQPASGPPEPMQTDQPAIDKEVAQEDSSTSPPAAAASPSTSDDEQEMNVAVASTSTTDTPPHSYSLRKRGSRRTSRNSDFVYYSPRQDRPVAEKRRVDDEDYSPSRSKEKKHPKWDTEQLLCLEFAKLYLTAV